MQKRTRLRDFNNVNYSHDAAKEKCRRKRERDESKKKETRKSEIGPYYYNTAPKSELQSTAYC